MNREATVKQLHLLQWICQIIIIIINTAATYENWAIHKAIVLRKQHIQDWKWLTKYFVMIIKLPSHGSMYETA
jgi:hypothetical protein